jgi:hypothetical protein
MLRFALHRQGQNCQVPTRWHARVWRGSPRIPQLKKHRRFGYRRPELNAQPSSHRRRGFLPTLNDRVSTLGVSR